jgi:sugar phosphate isomerase/epimerase
MTTRREFMKRSGALALGGMIVPHLSGASSLFGTQASHSVGVQLFTVMRQISEDLNGTLKKIADIGFTDIESAFSFNGPYYGNKPKDLKKLIESLGMKWSAHHVLGAPFVPPPGSPPMNIPKMDTLRDSYQKLVDEAAEGELKYLVCANTPIKTLDEIKASIEVLNKTGEACKKAGITLAYHNHDAEFKAVEGVIPYDLFLSTTTPDIKMELDLAWAIKGGVDPVELFKKNKGRFPLWHVKDLDKDTQKPVEIGKGTIDFKPIFDAAKESGMEYFFVEHDGAPSPIENLTTSFTNLKKIIN